MINIRSTCVAFVFSALVFALPSEVIAYDLTKARESKPKRTFSTISSIYDVERCIIGLDLADAPVVYRAPDRPDESLVYWPVSFRRPMLIEISRQNNRTVFSVKNPAATGLENRFEACEIK